MFMPGGLKGPGADIATQLLRGALLPGELLPRCLAAFKQHPHEEISPECPCRNALFPLGTTTPTSPSQPRVLSHAFPHMLLLDFE
jgi:hypothetical protein